MGNRAIVKMVEMTVCVDDEDSLYCDKWCGYLGSGGCRLFDSWLGGSVFIGGKVKRLARKRCDDCLEEFGE